MSDLKRSQAGVTVYSMKDTNFFHDPVLGLIQGVVDEESTKLANVLTVYRRVLLDIPHVACSPCSETTSTFHLRAYNTLTVPFTSRSQRRNYMKGDPIRVAVNCGRSTKFRVGTVEDVIPGVGCRAMDCDQIIPFDCIYHASPNWPTFHERCRAATIAWLLCSKTLLVNDLRKLIAQMIWKTRDDPEWGDAECFHEHVKPINVKRIKTMDTFYLVVFALFLAFFIPRITTFPFASSWSSGSITCVFFFLAFCSQCV